MKTCGHLIVLVVTTIGRSENAKISWLDIATGRDKSQSLPRLRDVMPARAVTRIVRTLQKSTGNMLSACLLQSARASLTLHSLRPPRDMLQSPKDPLTPLNTVQNVITTP